jgi:hypothetical protein
VSIWLYLILFHFLASGLCVDEFGGLRAAIVAVHGRLGYLQAIVVQSRLHGLPYLLENLRFELVFNILSVAARLASSFAAVWLQ